MNRVARTALMSLAPLALTACGGDEAGTAPPIGTPPPAPAPSPAPLPEVSTGFDFALGADGWQSGFAEYGADQDEATFEFETGLAQVPPDVNGQGFALGAINRSDDLLMYLSSAVSGLEPSQLYRVEARVSVATNVPGGCVGIGGAPGESVFIKAGANDEPVERLLDTSTGQARFEVNIDHGNQSQGGSEAVVLGDFAQSVPTQGRCDASNPYSVKTLSTDGAGPLVTADPNGRLFPFIATDSGFEGRTRIFWLNGEFTFVPVM